MPYYGFPVSRQLITKLSTRFDGTSTKLDVRYLEVLVQVSTIATQVPEGLRLTVALRTLLVETFDFKPLQVESSRLHKCRFCIHWMDWQ